MPGKILIVERYARNDLRNNPTWLFVFGDNMARRGFGGQAKACRGEPNAVGIPTKWTPTMDSGAFFFDVDFRTVRPRIEDSFLKLVQHLRDGGTVVWPQNGVGTGLARLEEKAPAIFNYIQEWFGQLESIINE